LVIAVGAAKLLIEEENRVPTFECKTKKNEKVDDFIVMLDWMKGGSKAALFHFDEVV